MNLLDYLRESIGKIIEESTIKGCADEGKIIVVSKILAWIKIEKMRVETNTISDMCCVSAYFFTQNFKEEETTPTWKIDKGTWHSKNVNFI